MSPIYVFDPTINDPLSKVRGVGRYLQILKENFKNDFTFSDKLPPTNYHLQTAFINPFFNFLKPPITFKRIAQKQIAVIHDLIPLKYPKHFPIGIKGRINIYLNKLALKAYDIIVTDSEQSKRDIINTLRLNDRIVKVIYPTLPKMFLNYEARIMKQEFINSEFCLYLGDATWNKNLVNLAKAIKIINVTCVFVGKIFETLQNIQGSKIPVLSDLGGAHPPTGGEHAHGDEKQRIKNLEKNNVSLTHPWQREFKQFIEETKDDKRFIFTGFLPDESLIKLYQQTRVNILPSRDEGFGFSYLEAASQKTPSVLSNIPVFKEIAQDTAYFSDANDPNSLANKIGELYFNNELRNNLSIKAQQRAKFFSAEKFVNAWKQIINL